MDETSARLAAMEAKIDKIYISVEKTRHYFQWTVISSVAMFVIPGILLAIAIPFFLKSYVGGIQSEESLIQ